MTGTRGAPKTRVDMHVKVLTDQVIARAKDRGIDALVYAPHFTRLPKIRQRAREYTDDDLLVVPGREVFTGSWHDRKHVLALGLDEPVPDFVTLAGAMAEFDRQGAAVIVPHPEFLTISCDAADIAAHRGVIDAIEIYNSKFPPHATRRAKRIASSFDLPPVASSYAHLPRTAGLAYTAFDRPIDDEADLVAAIGAGAGRTVTYRRGPDTWGQRLVEMGHIVYENSWKKADRVFLSGTEPTHPRHIAYCGRFDDVTVY